jgi:hypothetical protein
MGLMDRVKAQASQLAQSAADATQEGKNRLDQASAQRRGDGMLRQLGALVLAERTGRGAPDSQAQIDRLVNEITSHEQASGLNLTTPPAGMFGAGGPAQGGGQPPFQGGGQAPFQGGGQAPFQGGGQAPFQGGGEAPPAQGGDPAGYEGPSTINTGPFFTAPGDDAQPGAGPQ